MGTYRKNLNRAIDMTRRMYRDQGQPWGEEDDKSALLGNFMGTLSSELNTISGKLNRLAKRYQRKPLEAIVMIIEVQRLAMYLEEMAEIAYEVDRMHEVPDEDDQEQEEDPEDPGRSPDQCIIRQFPDTEN